MIICIVQGAKWTFMTIKLTNNEHIKRSRLKKDMLAEDPSWTYSLVKLHLAQCPELWIPKRKPITDAQYQKRLKQLKEYWCPAEIIRWTDIINQADLKIKKKELE